jgi:hypothetical protein
MNRPRRPVRGVAALAAAALTVSLVPALAATTSATAATDAPLECPAGTVATQKTAGERAFEREQADPAFDELLSQLDQASLESGAQCRPLREVQVESFAEMQVMQAQRNALTAGPLGYTPPGALRSALGAKQQAAAAASEVPGAEGTFTPLGETPLIADDPRFDNVNGLGLADQAGRIDSFVYDDVNDRLFSGPGTGGVWMTTDLGQSWTSVGDALPYQSVGAIDWSPDGPPGQGTLLVLSGEATAGGNNYSGIGAFYSTDTGQTWQTSTGIPDGLMGFEIEVDPTDPTVVYAATSQGLYRSTDTGRTFANVVLPTGTLETPDGETIDCAGKTGYDNLCQNANWVTDVEIKAPGGVGEDTEGGQVIAAVGFRAGKIEYPGVGTPQSPRNGLYRSDTGEVGSFTYLEDIYASSDDSPDGFAVQNRVGRTELSGATGPEQDHDYLYAIVEDAVAFQGGAPTIDAFETNDVLAVPQNTVFNGIYVSDDFGSSWTRMADEKEVSESPITESALIGTGQAIFFAPGAQAWYNMFIEPDPTTATEDGIPTRLVFGLEEVWESRRSGSPQDGREAARADSFRVIGPYFADDTCAFLDNPFPTCPTQQTSSGLLTTHPDQQAGIWIPQDDGGVALVIGNDGGAYVQDLAAGESLSKDKWGRGNQRGFNTLLPYDVEVAKDGTVAFGLQDNGSGVIEPDGTVVETFGGDGFFTAIDPDNSDVYYNETTFANMRVTTDGGRNYRSIDPPVSRPMFSNPFVMDPTDANHLLTAGPEVVERLEGPEGEWVEVFNLDEEGENPRQMSAVELEGEAAYVGFCSTCDIVNKNPERGQIFESGLATNMGGDEPAAKGSPAGWHIAAANGLPDRYISSIAVDPTDKETIYVTLAGYANRQWWPPGSFNDANDNRGEGHVFKSTDAGENFVDITGSLPDVPARFVEVNRGQLLVGTDIGVFLSNNTDGQTWAALSGLPNAPVTAIDNHPGRDDQVVISTFGRGFYSYTFSRRVGDVVPEAKAREIFDACPQDRVPRDSRQDDDGNVHEFAIDCMVWYEIAKGTTLENYEPAVPVSRAQMASFIARLIEQSGGELPAEAEDAFSDDDGQAPHEENINKLAAAGIVAGKGDGTYDPQGTVTRAQMAKFIVEAYEFRSEEDIVVPGDYFSDDDGNVHEDDINKSAAAGFTNGRGGGYEPSGVVRRDQMASFLARTLDLLVEEGTAQAKQ